ncbi:MAG: hypothetical protein ACRET6_12560 [Burkholderiales bacterium]
MSREIFSLMVVLAGMAMAGCGNDGRGTNDRALPEYRAGERGVLRVRTDSARGRLWVLGVDDVRVYDSASKRLVRRIVLQNWDMARFICEPDMLLDPSGSAIISSNMRAKLWRIDADSLKVEEREIRLREREQWDVGFGALMLAADGKLLALSSTGGWLWKVDPDAGTAHLWNRGVPMLNVCDLMHIE